MTDCFLKPTSALLNRLAAVRNQFAVLHDQFAAMRNRFAAVHSQFAVLHDQFAAVRNRFAAVHNQFAADLKQFAAVKSQFAAEIRQFITRKWQFYSKRRGGVVRRKKTRLTNPPNYIIFTLHLIENEVLIMLIANPVYDTVFKYLKELLRTLDLEEIAERDYLECKNNQK